LSPAYVIAHDDQKNTQVKLYNVWYTYSILILCTALSVARMQKEFCRSCQHGTQGLHYNVRSALNIIICKSTIYNDITH